MSDRIDEDSSHEQDPQHEPAQDQQAERARRRLQLRAQRVGIVAMRVLTSVVAVVAATITGGRRVSQARAQSATAKRQIDALLARVPEAGNVLGSPRHLSRSGFFGDGVPDLPCVPAARRALADLPVGAQWATADRIPLATDCPPLACSVHGSAEGHARSGNAGRRLVLDRALLPRTGPRGHGLHNIRIAGTSLRSHRRRPPRPSRPYLPPAPPAPARRGRRSSADWTTGASAVHDPRSARCYRSP